MVEEGEVAAAVATVAAPMPRAKAKALPPLPPLPLQGAQKREPWRGPRLLALRSSDRVRLQPRVTLVLTQGLRDPEFPHTMRSPGPRPA